MVKVICCDRTNDAELVGRLISVIGTEKFGTTLDDYIRCIVDFDMSCILAFSLGRHAKLIHNGYDKSVPRKVINAYLQGGFLLDPFYVAACNNHPSGLWRMQDLAPDSFHTSGFLISQDVHPCVSSEAGSLVEEIGYIVPLQRRDAIVFSLMRSQGRAAFSETEMQTLGGQKPIIQAALQTHWSQLHLPQLSHHEKENESDDADFARIFEGRLTATQLAVAKLILRGHSSLSIAQHLKISEGTAKLHRHNIYKRLAITSQGELFRIFIGHLQKGE